VIAAELPDAGTYRIEMSTVVVGTPCGTCSASYEGGAITATLADGDELTIPIGSVTSIS